MEYPHFQYEIHFPSIRVHFPAGYVTLPEVKTHYIMISDYTTWKVDGSRNSHVGVAGPIYFHLGVCKSSANSHLLMNQ